MLDKITLLNYCRLPVVLAEQMFSRMAALNSEDNKQDFISEEAFIHYLTKIFASDFNTRAKLCFDL